MPFEPRNLDDARTLRALAHPLRVELMDQLTFRGPLTATQCAELVGESPSSCSFHLRTLAKYGFTNSGTYTTAPTMATGSTATLFCIDATSNTGTKFYVSSNLGVTKVVAPVTGCPAASTAW